MRSRCSRDPDDRAADRVEGASSAGAVRRAGQLSGTEPNRLTRGRGVPGLVTDGAFFPDGRHLVLRDYGAGGRLHLPRPRDGRRGRRSRRRSRARGSRSTRTARVYVSSEGATRRCSVPLPAGGARRGLTGAHAARRLDVGDNRPLPRGQGAAGGGADREPRRRAVAARHWLFVARRRVLARCGRVGPSSYLSPLRALRLALRRMGPCRACARPRPTSPAGAGAARGRASSTSTSTASGSGRGRAAGPDLVIPPAWKDVWVTPYENGHLQAVGTDEAGRRQYLYHPDWRARRDAEKFDRMLEFGRALVRARERVLVDLGTRGDAAGARLRGRRTAARPGLLPDRQRRVRRRARQLRADHAGAAARTPPAGPAGLRVHRQVGDRAPRSRSTTPRWSRRSR